MHAGDFLRHHWPTVTIAVTAAAIACAGVGVFSSMPPHRIVMATGPEGGDYYELGESYRAVLAREGVEVRLVPTAGSVENLALLHDPHSGVSVGLIQGGIADASNKSMLESLGTVFYEPLWWFRKRGIEGEGTVRDLLGRKISIGPEGSGTRRLTLELFKTVGLIGKAEVLALPPREAAEKLSAGDIDVMFLMASWDSPLVRQLLADERVTLSGYARADALIGHYPFLHRLVLSRGVADLPRDVPPSNVVLIATKASLVVRNDLHAALQYLLLNAAVEIHSGAGIFRRANEFPAPEAVGIPLSSEALRFYKSGMPLLNEYFPFWMAELIGKLFILVIPIIGVLYPMMAFLPRLYDRMMRSKISRVYGDLWLLKDEMANARNTGRDTAEIVARLDRLEKHVNRLRMPATYASTLYTLRDHVEQVRANLQKPGQGAEGTVAPAAHE